MKELREYQENIINKVTHSNKDQIICLPTGAGKTVIAGNIINKLKETVVFIVPRLELITQAKEEFSQILGDIDII